jgi:hypothetical protein
MFQILFPHQLRRGLQHGLPRIPGRSSDVRNQVRELRIHRFPGINIFLLSPCCFPDLEPQHHKKGFKY